MITPRLQMKQPYSSCYDNIQSVDVHRYMNEYGFIGGLSTAWSDYVHEMFEHFDAGLAANEGMEAVVRDLMPARRRLSVRRHGDRGCTIECNEGGARICLWAGDDDSLILSVCSPGSSDAESGIDLGCYDSAEAASFIAHAFKAYRDLNSRFWRAVSNS